MQKTIDETEYRRTKQIKYNTKHNITPKALKKAIDDTFGGAKKNEYQIIDQPTLAAAEEAAELYSEKDLKSEIKKARGKMELAAKDLDFMEAARYRDELKMLQEKLKEKKI